MITVASPHSVAQTVERLKTALAGRSITVFAAIDHAAGAREAGQELPDETVVIFGDARAGTPLMQRDQTVGIELPLKILVWDEQGRTMVGYHDPRELAGSYRLDGLEERLAHMRDLLDQLAAEAAAAGPGTS